MNHRYWRIRRVVATALLGLAFGLAQAQAPDPQEERKAAIAAVAATKVDGPSDISLRDQAVLKLPAGYSFAPAPAAAKLLRAMGNRPDDRLMGAVFPASGDNWFVIINFVKEGYIKDDDARDWNPDDLLKNLRDGTEISNEERTRRGIPPVEVVGWAEKPHYDATAHRLVWSATIRDKGSSGTQGLGVNYNTYALGRDGYISLNMVTSLDELVRHKESASTLLSALNYGDGKKYADFNSSTDHVAAYGLAALVAGAAAKKLGLLAVVLAFAAKFAKVIVVAVGGVLWGVGRMFRKKSATTPPPPDIK